MSYDESYEIEDWYEEDDEPDDDEPVPCPECGGPIHGVTDKCPACGYWLSEADRRAMWSGMDKPVWLKVTAVIVLITIVMGLLAAGIAFF
jgi:hypothetical protein